MSTICMGEELLKVVVAASATPPANNMAANIASRAVNTLK